MSGGKVYTVEPGDLSRRITTATTTAVLNKTGIVKNIIIGKALTGTVTLNDSSGTLLSLDIGAAAGSYNCDMVCVGKIEVVTTATDNVTVTYMPA